MSEQLKPESSNVVPLRTERNTAGYVPLTRLPPPLQALRDQARQQLQTLLRELFDRADDALFDLADKAGSNQEQNLYFESMREVRIRRVAIEAAFFNTFDNNLLLLMDTEAQRNVAEANQRISVDELSLVKNDELEETVAVDSMINKSTERFANLLQPLTQRMDHLVPVKVYQNNNPLAPFALCQGFSEAMRPLRVDVKARLLLFKLFDQRVLGKLSELYQRLNQLLMDANVLPTLPSLNRASTRVGNAVAAESQASFGHTEEANQASEVLQTLRMLLGNRQPSVAVTAAYEQQMLDSAGLLQLLSHAQQNPKGDSVQHASLQTAVDLRQLIQQVSAHQGMSVAINPVDDDVINLVGMMFEFILDDRNLAAPMKALIGRLQIPLVKVAIADKHFFSKGSHPARRLLNEMACAALGWQEDAEENRRADSLLLRMEAMVTDILADVDGDVDIFSRLLVDFQGWLDKERRRAQILEQRTLDAEDGKAKAEQARAEVNRTLETIVGPRPIPEAGLALLHNAWANVMFITALKHGTGSAQWQTVNKTAELLVWSLTVAMTTDNRKQLLKTVPVLLQQLRKGLESIAFNPFETTRLFKQLEVLHLSRLKTPPVETPAAAVLEAEAPIATGVTDNLSSVEVVVTESVDVCSVEAEPVQADPVAVIANEPLPLEPLDAAGEPSVALATAAKASSEDTLPDNDPHYRLVNNLTQGCWFEMTDASGQRFRCRLAAIIRATGKYIFVNRSGMKVAEETRSSLALALKNGRLLLLDDSMLFDRALEAVIGSLREQRGT